MGPQIYRREKALKFADFNCFELTLVLPNWIRHSSNTGYSYFLSWSLRSSTSMFTQVSWSSGPEHSPNCSLNIERQSLETDIWQTSNMDLIVTGLTSQRTLLPRCTWSSTSCTLDILRFWCTFSRRMPPTGGAVATTVDRLPLLQVLLVAG